MPKHGHKRGWRRWKSRASKRKAYISKLLGDSFAGAIGALFQQPALYAKLIGLEAANA